MAPDPVSSLACPICRTSLGRAGATLTCASGHSFDLARQGYVNLLAGGRTTGHADTADMVAARARFIGSGSYVPLADALASEVSRHLDPKVAGAFVDVGAGTGWLLAHLLNAWTDRAGVALDLSRYAARRAAGAHERALAAVCDAWARLPIADCSASLVLNFFAPRNPPEFARILAPGGMAVIVTPLPEHLVELIGPLAMVTVDEEKGRRVDLAFSGWAPRTEPSRVRYEMKLTHDLVRDLVLMGPTAFHTTVDALNERLRSLPDPVSTTAAFDVRLLTPPRNTTET